MTRTPDRQAATLLIEAAVTAGARRANACTVSEFSERTLRRWTRDGPFHGDQGRKIRCEVSVGKPYPLIAPWISFCPTAS